jgi:hypothetical protein
MKTEWVERASSSRPKDQSLEAYKDWIHEIVRRLTTRSTQIELTEAEWIMFWKDFWKEKSQR